MVTCHEFKTDIFYAYTRELANAYGHRTLFLSLSIKIN